MFYTCSATAIFQSINVWIGQILPRGETDGIVESLQDQRHQIAVCDDNGRFCRVLIYICQRCQTTLHCRMA